MMVRSIVPCNGTSIVPADNGFPSPVRRLRDGEKDGENTRVTSKNDTQMKKLSKRNELTQGNLRKKRKWDMEPPMRYLPWKGESFP